MTEILLSPNDMLSLAALFLLIMVGKYSSTESRALMAGLVVATLTGSPQALIVLALLWIPLSFLDSMKGWFS